MDKRGVPGAMSPVALRLPGLPTGYQTVARIRRFALPSGEVEICRSDERINTRRGPAKPPALVARQPSRSGCCGYIG